MSMDIGATYILITCRHCGRTSGRWLDEFPPAARGLADLTSAAKDKLRCSRCGADAPRVMARWEPKATKFRRPR